MANLMERDKRGHPTGIIITTNKAVAPTGRECKFQKCLVCSDRIIYLDSMHAYIYLDPMHAYTFVLRGVDVIRHCLHIASNHFGSKLRRLAHRLNY